MMSDLTLFGLPPSTYVRTAMMTFEAKGVPYDLEFPDFRSGAYRDIHPFGRIPALRHGNVTLYETLAITTYIDEAFDGPALQPVDPLERARMLQWISAIIDYMYSSFVRGCVAERFVKPMRGMAPDEAVIAKAKPEISNHLEIVDATLSKTPFLAGNSLSLADFFLAPILRYLAHTPEGKDLMPGLKGIDDWSARVAESKGYAQVNQLPASVDA
jgi:glutathione S-transferase